MSRMTRWAPALAALGAGLLVLLAGQVQAERTRGQLDDLRDADCPVLLAQAGAPFAPGAAHDAGALSSATQAGRSYVLHGCADAGYGPVPPVFTVGVR